MPFLKEDYLQFKSNVHQILSGIELPMLINEDEQNDFVDSVKPLVNNERFLFIVDLISFELKNCIGVERWLGYPKHHFSMFDYLKAIHPAYVHQLMQMALAAIEVTNQNTGICKFIDQRIIVCQPIQEKNGKYWWVKRETTPFQFDSKGRLTAYANLFTIVKEYEGESLSPRYSDQSGNRRSDLYELFVERYRGKIRSSLPFTKRQFEILTLYANYEGLTSTHVSQQLSISKQTIDKHNQSILMVARTQFPKHFSSALEVALFLRGEKIL